MVTKFRRRRKEQSYCRKICVSQEKIEKLLSIISPARYLENKTEKRNLFYNPKDPIIIGKRWIREYKKELREHNNYTNYN